MDSSTINPEPKEAFSVYLLRSKTSNFRYVGMTNNLARRIQEHNRGEVKSTAPYRPFSHIVLGNHVCRSEARKAERYFKSGFGRKAIDHLLKHYGPP
ncbi:MAG TPA: GIY-YIG nuclease family protein [Kiritimatiellia bacterium]|nr:GIY-YIG nuclease family protein [Kiritimatiellia bacterium]HMP00284.1 GIY-YIG nuclease family protein [Kiritimatiellia bacterium]